MDFGEHDRVEADGSACRQNFQAISSSPPRLLGLHLHLSTAWLGGFFSHLFKMAKSKETKPARITVACNACRSRKQKVSGLLEEPNDSATNTNRHCSAAEISTI